MQAEEKGVGTAVKDSSPAKYGRIFAAFIVLAVLAAGAWLFWSQNAKSLVPKPQAQDTHDESRPAGLDLGEKLFSLGIVKRAFAQGESLRKEIAAKLSYGLPKRDELSNLSAFEDGLSDEQLAALEQRGFFLTANKNIETQEWGQDDFSDTYKSFSGSTNKYFREADEALFISSDAALHLYHILADRSFQKIEEEKFQPLIKEMSKVLFDDSLKRYNEEKDEMLKASYARLSAFYLVPLVVLDAADRVSLAKELKPEDFSDFAKYQEAQTAQEDAIAKADFRFSLDGANYGGQQVPAEIHDLAAAELKLMSKAESVADSPIFTPLRPYFQNDYTQFTPRSHYTKNATLKSYFIAMMWYGRMGFSLDSPELTRDALIMNGQIASLQLESGSLARAYGDLSSAIEFFVGEVDDLTPYEFSPEVEKIFGKELSQEELADTKLIDDFRAAAVRDLPKPRIVSESVALYDDSDKRDELLKQLMQFRFFGQRFTPDAYVMNRVTQGVGAPDPETGQKLPSMTSALMPIRVLAPQNSVVNSYVDAWIKKNAPDSDRIFAKRFGELDKEFAAFAPQVWQQNIYWRWLDSYRSLLSGYGEGYPAFMIGDAWQKKNLGTVLGSYTELKHDTLLYAKQSYAELGGGGDEPDKIPPVPMGYVEADPAFWQKIVELAKLTDTGLRERGLMPEEYGERFASFIDETKFYSELANKEVQDQAISEEDFERLRKTGHVMNSLTAPLAGKELATKDRRAGIIADIHTDAVEGKILYEATGKPFIIYVAVKDKNGTRLTRGLAYSQYELVMPLAKRLTDEDWQAIVYDGEGAMPIESNWQKSIVN